MMLAQVEATNVKTRDRPFWTIFWASFSACKEESMGGWFVNVVDGMYLEELLNTLGVLSRLYVVSNGTPCAIFEFIPS